MTEEQNKEVVKSADNNKLCAILSYLLIGVVWYFVDDKIKKDEFAKFHVKQAVTLLIADIIANAVLAIIPVLGWMLIPILNLAVLVLVVIGIMNAINNEKKELPYIGQYASKLKF